ncbi:MAG: cob(I)yrinic acid a,c-diamide adenosyltransferase [Phycisphaerae bacterium]|nr:cob(I)yrinic acid a,c-diamide adenosyltransferase [Phycisphaerae bacterium]
MKLYTRTGDDGTTGLFGGGRVSKDHPRIEAYGTVDELNAGLGLAAAACGEDPTGQRFREILASLQSRLFDIGADLATPEGSPLRSRLPGVGERHVAELERWIDEVDGAVPPIRTFVLPGGTELAARLHLARTVCRRAERLIVALGHSEPVGDEVVRFVNRVSDLLFAMARGANHAAGVPDVPWTPGDPTAA